MRKERTLLRVTILLFLVALWLIGCATTPPTNVSIPNNPAANVTNTPTSDSGQAMPQVNTCPSAIQLIEQNQLGGVKIYKELSNQGTDIIVMIGLRLRKSPQGYTGVPDNEVDVLLPSKLYANCSSQVLDAVNQVNKGLSKDKQVQVDESYIPAQQ